MKGRNDDSEKRKSNEKHTLLYITRAKEKKGERETDSTKQADTPSHPHPKTDNLWRTAYQPARKRQRLQRNKSS